jgi:hypothetical protein
MMKSKKTCTSKLTPILPDLQTCNASIRDKVTLTRKRVIRILASMRALLQPNAPQGKKRFERYNAAHLDWKKGMRGVPFYRLHIPDHDKLSHWPRKRAERALVDAMIKRDLREQIRAAFPAYCLGLRDAELARLVVPGFDNMRGLKKQAAQEKLMREMKMEQKRRQLRNRKRRRRRQTESAELGQERRIEP